MTNSMLSEWSNIFGLPPFAAIQDADFAAAFAEGMAQARANITKIANNPDAPSFVNVIEALEQAEDLLDRVGGVFFNLTSADSSDVREALQHDLAPVLSAFSSEITNNKVLFSRIEALFKQQEHLNLSAEQARVLELYAKMFIRSGAHLEGKAAERLTDVKSRLAVLGTKFGQNLLAEERSWCLKLSPQDLADLPNFVVAAARTAGQERDMPAVLTLSRSLIVPFLQFSPNRTLRERAYGAWVARGANGNEHDNRAIAAEILALRAERADLLGYKSFADFKLEPEMAKTPQAVRDLLMRVWQPARAKATEDAAILTKMMQAHIGVSDLKPWDWRYYSERRRKVEHNLDEAALQPYLSLDAMIDAAFDCANRLFGLEFRALNIPLYHADARAWEVTKDGIHIAVFIGDYFSRSSKRSGAWCSAMRTQRKLGGDRRPIVVNVCNFAKANPCLLSYDDARTLFHEFGHAL
ncbi:MAG: M3 family metallopeptidase, partial [Paracoccaceae bacterium]